MTWPSYGPVFSGQAVRIRLLQSIWDRADFNGTLTSYTYDALNRVLTRTSNHPNAAASNVSFTYTPSGQRWTMTDATGTTTYGYDHRRANPSLIYYSARRLDDHDGDHYGPFEFPVVVNSPEKNRERDFHYGRRGYGDGTCRQPLRHDCFGCDCCGGCGDRGENNVGDEFARFMKACACEVVQVQSVPPGSIALWVKILEGSLGSRMSFSIHLDGCDVQYTVEGFAESRFWPAPYVITVKPGKGNRESLMEALESIPRLTLRVMDDSG